MSMTRAEFELEIEQQRMRMNSSRGIPLQAVAYPTQHSTGVSLVPHNGQVHQVVEAKAYYGNVLAEGEAVGMTHICSQDPCPHCVQHLEPDNVTICIVPDVHTNDPYNASFNHPPPMNQ